MTNPITELNNLAAQCSMTDEELKKFKQILQTLKGRIEQKAAESRRPSDEWLRKQRRRAIWYSRQEEKLHKEWRNNANK